MYMQSVKLSGAGERQKRSIFSLIYLNFIEQQLIHFIGTKINQKIPIPYLFPKHNFQTTIPQTTQVELSLHINTSQGSSYMHSTKQITAYMLVILCIRVKGHVLNSLHKSYQVFQPFLVIFWTWNLQKHPETCNDPLWHSSPLLLTPWVYSTTLDSPRLIQTHSSRHVPYFPSSLLTSVATYTW
jgi:hypothetical protein